nr:HAD family hydrolase [Treponema paraluiscuniculi]
MTRACIFDLDGTLTNTLETIAYFVNMQAAHYHLPPIPSEKFALFLGDGSRALIQRVLAHYGAAAQTISEDEFLQRYCLAYEADFLQRCTVYPGVPEMLVELKRRRIELAILSNKPHSIAQKVASAFFGDNVFSVVLGQREGVPVKPDPAGLFEILRTLNVETAEALFVGDTAVDIRTASAAQVRSVGVLWGFRDATELSQAQAHVLIRTPAELLQHLSF